VLAEVQGSFTFPPQQMPHASTYIQNAPFEFAGVKPLLSGIRRGRGWDVSYLDGMIGANKVYRNFIASLMMNKSDVIVLICLILEERRGRVTQIIKRCTT